MATLSDLPPKLQDLPPKAGGLQDLPPKLSDLPVKPELAKERQESENIFSLQAIDRNMKEPFVPRNIGEQIVSPLVRTGQVLYQSADDMGKALANVFQKPGIGSTVKAGFEGLNYAFSPLTSVVRGIGVEPVHRNLGVPQKYDEPVTSAVTSLIPFAGLSKRVQSTLDEASKSALGIVSNDIKTIVSPKVLTRGIIREDAANFAREQELANRRLMAFSSIADRLKPEEQLKFIDNIETGNISNISSNLQPLAKELRNILDDRRTKIQALGKGQLEHFIENYFPHLWEEPSMVNRILSKRSLAGPASFLKQRVFPTMQDGIKAGFKPLTTNPIDLTLLKVREMDRYLMGQKIFGEMKDKGISKFVRFGEKPPEGWAKINDKIARVLQFSEAEKGFVIRGEYYSPQEAANSLNNFLSPGLIHSPNAWVKGGYNASRYTANMMNSVQLGLSGFHAGFTTFDAMVSQVALGVKQIAEGHPLKGIGNVLGGSLPTAPVMNLLRGNKLFKAYENELVGAKNPELQRMVEALVAGGGRVRMDAFYRASPARAFSQAIKEGKNFKAARLGIPTLIDKVNYPIFQWLVPRQKLGVFYNMARYELEKNPHMSPEQIRVVMGKAWDSVDNRLGEMVYDNLFWDKTIKDLGMISVRSLGWNLGTFRELVGGAKDTAFLLKNKEFTQRMSYVIALPYLTGLYGATLGYLYTGKSPQEIKDYFFPKTGRKRPDGSDDRVSLPTYMKDVFEWMNDPVQTLKNKLNPLVSTVFQMLDNKDFFGGAIMNPDDPIMKMAQDEFSYMAQQFTPFSIRNYRQQTQVKGETGSILGYFTSPQFVGITPSPGYIVKTKEQQEALERKLRKPALRKKAKEEQRGLR